MRNYYQPSRSRLRLSSWLMPVAVLCLPLFMALVLAGQALNGHPLGSRAALAAGAVVSVTTTTTPDLTGTTTPGATGTGTVVTTGTTTPGATGTAQTTGTTTPGATGTAQASTTPGATGTAQTTGTTTPGATGTAQTTGTTTPGATGTAQTTGTTTPGATGTAQTTGTPGASCTPIANVGVAINDSGFTPATLTVDPGTRITWTNTGSSRHRVRDINHVLFDSGDLSSGQQFSYTFCVSGTYLYEDSRSSAQGTITVSGTAATGTPGTPGATGTAQASTTPGATGTAQASTTPGATGTAQVSTTPGATGTAHASTTPGATGTAQVSTTPGATGTAHASTTPGATGTAQVSTTPGATGTAHASITPGATGTAQVSTTPGATGTAQVSTTPGPGFQDVLPTEYFYTPVNWLVAQSAISGYSDGTFRPYNNITRGQITKVLVLAHNWTLLTPATATFSDVPVGSTFYSFVETAVARGLVSGYNDGTFRPSDNVTRGQIAKIVTLAEGWAVTNPPTGAFSDVPTSSIFYGFIETAAQHMVLTGYSDGSFRPANTATRGQGSKIIYYAITNP